MDSIYINGVKADMQADSNIYLTYNSNLFGDLSKINGNYSSTITLPVTAKNTSIIESCFHVGTDSNFPYQTNVVSIYRNGVPIVQNASLVLLKTSNDGYEVSVIWGASDKIKQIINGNDTLNDLDFQDLQWTASGNTYTPKADYGQRYDDKSVSSHPVVSVADILSAIATKYKTTFVYDTKPWEQHDWVIPLLQRNADEYQAPTWKVIRHTNSSNIKGKFDTDEGHFELLSFYNTNRPVFDNKYVVFATIGDESDPNSLESDYALPVCKGVTQAPKGTITIKVSAASANAAYACTFVLVTYAWGKSSVLLEVNQSGNPKDKGNGIYELTFVLTGNDFSDPMKLDDDQWQDGGFTYYGIKGNVSILTTTDAVSGTLAVKYSQDKVYYGNPKPNESNTELWSASWYQWYRTKWEDKKADMLYPVSKNLPKMKISDFIKNIMQMSGKVAMPVGNQLKFVSNYTLYTNKNNGVYYDLTKQLITNQEWMPSAEYKIGNEAQVNNMLFADGNEEHDMNVSWKVDNQTLDSTTDYIKLNFVGYNCVGSYAHIPLYTYKYETEEDAQGNKSIVIKEVDFKSTDKPYIAQRKSNPEGYYLTNERIKWSWLLEAYYGGESTTRYHEDTYMQMYDHAKVITENFILSDVFLNKVQLTTPIYLAQHGAFFGIISIKTKANNKAEIKMVKL